MIVITSPPTYLKGKAIFVLKAKIHDFVKETAVDPYFVQIKIRNKFCSYNLEYGPALI